MVGRAVPARRAWHGRALEPTAFRSSTSEINDGETRCRKASPAGKLDTSVSRPAARSGPSSQCFGSTRVRALPSVRWLRLHSHRRLCLGLVAETPPHPQGEGTEDDEGQLAHHEQD